MKVDIGWLSTAILFGMLLGKFLGGWFEDFFLVLSLVIITIKIVYTLYMIYTETY